VEEAEAAAIVMVAVVARVLAVMAAHMVLERAPQQVAAALPLAQDLDHIANHKTLVAQVPPVLAEAIAVLRFPQACPRIIIVISTTFSLYFCSYV